MDFYSNEKIGIFIDGSNLFAASKALEFEIDFKKLYLYFQSKGRLVRASYYTALLENHETSPMRPLIDWLEYNGYIVISKLAKEFLDAEGNTKVKGNMDIELAVDLIAMADHLDHIVLFSGDGDFRRVVEDVQLKGTRVTVVSTTQTDPPMIADELRRQCDGFIDLQDVKKNIQRLEDK